MRVTKAEGIAYTVGGLAILGAIAFRKKHPDAFPNAIIFGIGAILTGGAMGVYRWRTQRKLTAGVSGANLGLRAVGKTKSGGQMLTVWDDREMDLQHRILLLQQLVEKSVEDPTVRNLALAVTGRANRPVRMEHDTLRVVGGGCADRDDMCELQSIHQWVTGNIRYTGDTGPYVQNPGKGKNKEAEPVDEFQTAPRTVEYRGGDCDDHAVLNASLAAKNGFTTKFRITSNEGDTWDHIYVMAGIPKNDPKKWVALDTTLGPKSFNKQPARKKQVDFAV